MYNLLKLVFLQDFHHGCTIAPFNEWLIIPPAEATDADTDGHGTSVASKICGRMSGVAKKTTIIPVKIDPDRNDLVGITAMWRWTLDDIRRRQNMDPPTALAGKTIINISISCTPGNDIDRLGLSIIQFHIQSIIALDVVIVSAAGNKRIRQAGNPAIYSYPSFLASNSLPIIVASALDQQFYEVDFSNYGPKTSAWGIGVDVVVAVHNTQSFIKDSGTSFGG